MKRINMIKKFSGLLYECFNDITENLVKLDMKLVSFRAEDEYLLDITVQGSIDDIESFTNYLNGV